MAQDMESSYAALRNMAENTPSVNKKLVGEREMHRARALLREYNAKGYRIDGAPATASIYGVMPRKAEPAPSEPSKEEIKAGLLAELAAWKKEREEERERAERNAEADQRGEPERRAGQADKKTGADGVRPKAAGRDRQRRNANRGTAQTAERSRGEGKHREQARARGKLSAEQKAEIFREYCATEVKQSELTERYGVSIGTIKRALTEMKEAAVLRGELIPEKQIGKQGARGPGKNAPELTQEQEAAIYEEYAAGSTIPQLREKYGLTRHYVEAAIEAEGRRRGGEGILRKHASPTKHGLSAETQAAIFDAYAAGETAIALAEQFGISRYHTEKIIETEAKRRGVEKPKNHAYRKETRLSAEEQALFYQEYATTPVSVDELARKWDIGSGTAWRYIQKARLNGAEAETTKPKQSRRTVQLPEEQVREYARRRDMGESTAELAKELGVSLYALRSEFRRVVGNSKHGHNALAAEDKAELVNKYKAGVRYRELARLYHISSQTITQILDAAGIAQRGTNARKGITTSEVAERIEFPAIGKWMEEQGMSICTLAERIGTSVPTTYRWLTQGDSKHMTKGAIDTLMEMTGLEYPVLFAREKLGGVKPSYEQMEKELAKAKTALSVFVEWMEERERAANGKCEADDRPETGDREEI